MDWIVGIVAVVGMTFLYTALVLSDAIEAWVKRRPIGGTESTSSCEHDWVIERVAYSPPKDVSVLYWVDRGEQRERAVHGCTSILRVCNRCKRTDVRTLLGKEVPQPNENAWRTRAN